jgi:UPF0271 protein
MTCIDLNCDMGEGYGNDAAIMPYISSTNIACGFHAGDEATMQTTIRLALQYQVAIGAHPGFADKEHFGRRERLLPEEELYTLVTEQLFLLQQIARKEGARLNHVKPHGALYNLSAKDEAVAHTIARAVKDVDPSLLVFGLSNSLSLKAAAELGLQTVAEVFADRTYQPDGSLTPRSQPNALVENTGKAIEQVLDMVTKQQVTSTDGTVVPLRAETICIHGDGAHAVVFARQIHEVLSSHQIRIQHP